MSASVKFAGAVVAAVLLGAGCSFNTTPPRGAHIPCGPGGECPKPWVCRPEDNFCHPADANLDAPGVVSFDVSPKRGRVGTVFRVEMKASKALDGPPVIGPLAFKYNVEQSNPAELAWVFQYEATGAETEGERGLYAVLRDTDGNTSTVPLPGIVLDFTAPYLLDGGVKVIPALARPGDVAVVQLDLNETVADGAKLSVMGSGLSDLDSTVKGTSSLSYRFAVASSVPDGVYHLRLGHVVDLAGNTAADVTLDQSLSIDGTPPTITGLTLSRTRVSRIAPFNTFTATFTVSADTSVARAFVRERPMNCAAPVSNVVTCTYTTSSADGEGQAPVRAEASDLAGNNAVANTSVEMDFTPPVVIVDSLNLLLTPPSGSLVSTVTAVAVGARWTSTFAYSEAVGVPVDVHTGAVAMTCTPLGPALSSCTHVLASGELPEGAATISATLVDAVGNSSTATVGQVTIDTVAPAAPDVSTVGRIEYARRPWGSYADGLGAAMSVRGLASAVAGAGTVLVHSAATAPRAELGRGISAADGSFASLTLQPTDRAQVFVSFVDGAGNASASVRVRDVLFTATLLGKTGPTAVDNPNVLWAEPIAWPNSLPVSDPARVAIGLRPAYLNDVMTGTRPAWRELVSALGPRAAVAMTFDTSRQRAVVFGGALGNPISETWEYVSATQKWVRPFQANAPNLAPNGRWNAAVTYDSANKRVVMFGGLTSSGPERETWEYDVITQAWSKPPSANPPNVCPSPRSRAAMGFDSTSGKIVLFGGTSTGTIINNETWEYDVMTRVWTKPASANSPNTAPSARYSHAMTVDAVRSKAILYGGTAGSNETWEYSFATHSWSMPATANAPNTVPGGKSNATMAFDTNRNIAVLVGGTASGGDTWEYNAIARTWSKPAAGNTPNATPPAAYDEGLAYDPVRGALILFGGTLSASGTHGETWEYSGTTPSWTKPSSANPVNSAPGPRSQNIFAFDSSRNREVLFGVGVGSSGLFQNETYELDLSTVSWSRPTTANSPVLLPGARQNASGVYDSTRAKVILFGGNAISGSINETWEYDVATQVWSKPVSANPPNTAPSIRYSHRAVYDAPRKKMIIFGGNSFSGTYNNETWEYDCTTQVWAKPATANSPNTAPTARYDHAMAYDATQAKTVLYGGSGSAFNFDTWEYDGPTQTWSKPAAANLPNPTPTFYAAMTMAFDPLRGKTVAFGGSAPSYFGTNELWEYDGASKTWSQPAAANPPNFGPVGRIGHMTVYDANRKRVVLFGGGVPNAGSLGDIWEYEPTGFGDTQPVLALSFITSASGYASALATSASLRALTGGNGTNLQTSTAISGVAVSRWSNDGWKLLGTSSGTTAAPTNVTFTITDATELAQAQARSDFYFQIAPQGFNATGAATATVKEAELEVRYRLP